MGELSAKQAERLRVQLVEVTSNLDDGRRHELADLVTEVAEEGGQVLVVSAKSATRVGLRRASGVASGGVRRTKRNA